jgi:formylglycine-generating enzyme required for sulfatase activity
LHDAVETRYLSTPMSERMVRILPWLTGGAVLALMAAVSCSPSRSEQGCLRPRSTGEGLVCEAGKRVDERGCCVDAPPAQVDGDAGQPPATPPTPSDDAPVSATSGSSSAVKAPGTWVLIKAGVFAMGSPRGEPGRVDWEVQHQVTLTHDFYLQTTEVTQGQFQEVMGYNRSYFRHCGTDCPTEAVTWHEAAAYCNALSVREGVPACYRCSGSGPTVTCETPGNLYECAGYRLPTEAEWEYAARAGTTTSVYTGRLSILAQFDAPGLDAIAWYGGNSGVTYEGAFDCSTWSGRQQNAALCGTHPAGQKQPNAWGLFDMIGNVSEWCSDWDAPYGEAATDPFGAESGSERVSRGGNWSSIARGERAASRGSQRPDAFSDFTGFRPARFAPRQ